MNGKLLAKRIHKNYWKTFLAFVNPTEQEINQIQLAIHNISMIRTMNNYIFAFLKPPELFNVKQKIVNY